MITAQVTKVTGIVIDADTNEPIIGASVWFFFNLVEKLLFRLSLF